MRHSRRKTLALVLGMGVAGLLPQGSPAAGPFEEYQGLVAGQGTAGHRDGKFNRALLNHPMGLALSEDHTTLFVADQENHLIRAIALDKNNEVSTFAGTGAPGKTNGPVSLASFNHPEALAGLPGGRLAVWDRDNGLIRVIDLQSKSVTVLAGGGSAKQDGPALQASLSGIWNMAYSSSDQSLYFSQPNDGLLRRLSLKDGMVETILSGDARVPQPAALCVVGNDIYVSNEGVTGTILCLKPNPSPQKDAKPVGRYLIEVVGQGHYVTSLDGLDDYLYAVQADLDSPFVELLPKNLAGPVSMRSWWGEPYSKDGERCPLFDANNTPLGFVADPLSKRRFYLCHPNRNFVASIRDLGQGLYSWDDMYNLGGLAELQYPLAKPAHTFRILVVGRSYSYFVYNRESKTFSKNHAENLAKRLELFLNLSASMDEQPLHYEVLSCGKIMGQSLYLWPMDVAPDLVKKYDIDLVFILMDPGIYLSDYFAHKPGPDGIPEFKYDDEYVLKPFEERVPPGTPQKFYDLGLKYHLIEPVAGSKTQMNFHYYGEMLEHADMKDCLLEMLGKPLEVLKQRLDAIHLSSGGSPKLEIGFFPGIDPTNDAGCCQDEFWGELTHKWGLDLMGLSDDLEAQRLALAPFWGSDHLDVNGMLWLGYVLSHEMISQKIVPWTTPSPVKNGK